MLTGFAKGSKRYFFVAVLGTALSILFSFLMPQVVGFTVGLGHRREKLRAARVFIGAVCKSRRPRFPARKFHFMRRRRRFMRHTVRYIQLYLAHGHGQRHGALYQEASGHAVHTYAVPAVFLAYAEPDRRYHPALHLRRRYGAALHLPAAS